MAALSLIVELPSPLGKRLGASVSGHRGVWVSRGLDVWTSGLPVLLPESFDELALTSCVVELLKYPVDRCPDDVVLLHLCDVEELTERALHIPELAEFRLCQPEGLA